MKILDPKSIAIVGASPNREKVGAAIFSNIINAGYQGRVFPVNPKYERLYGAVCYPTVKDIPEEVEMVVIAVPAAAVGDVVKQSIEKGVQTAIVVSAGYSEVGEEGFQREQRLKEIINGSDMRLLGPNCLGLIVPGVRLNASFANHIAKQGNISFLSQSGAFNTAMLDLAAKAELGFAHFVSIGNKIDLNEIDFLEEWLNDPEVEVIGMYLEEFDGARRLIELAQGSTKPIVILSPGRSAEARAAISSHTGSLADEATTIKAAMDKVNILQVENMEQMFNLLQFFSVNGSKHFGHRIGVVTNAGGPGVIATDLIAGHNLEIAKLSLPLQHQLAAGLPPEASTHNPIDILGGALADRYSFVVQQLIESDEIDTILVLLTPQYMTEIDKTAVAISALAKSSNKLILPVFLGGKEVSSGVQLLNEQGILAYQYLNDSLSALAAAIHWREHAKVEKHTLQPGAFVGQEQILNLSEIKKKVGVDDNTELPLPYSITRQLTDQVGIIVPEELLTNAAEEAVNFAEKVGYPVVVKATADQIVHKTDEKAIYLGLSDPDAVTTAVNNLQTTLYNTKGIEMGYVLVQRQLEGDGVQAIMGVKKTNFGHLLMFGAGGIYAEIMQDISSVILPANHAELEKLVSDTKISQILSGARNQFPLASHKVVEMLGQIQLLALTYPEISAIDLNPVFVNQEEAIAADVKVFL